MQMLRQNWQKLHLTGPQLKASLPLEDLCIFFWGVHCNVNFGMVEFAALTVWLHWMRCHNISGLHSAANMTEIMVSPKALDIQLVTAGKKKTASRRNAIPPTSVKTAAKGLHRIELDRLRYKHGGGLKHLESIWLSCLHWEQDKLTQLLVMQSAIIHLAITRPVCIIRENCHMIILCWPYLHATIELYTCRSTGCFTFCFLIGAMRWLSCKSAAKEVSTCSRHKQAN